MPEPQQDQPDQQEKIVDYLRRVTSDLRRARRRLGELESKDNEPIAIVGMGCRLPGGVNSPESLWDLVRSGADAISGFPADRGWDLETLTGKGDGSSTTHQGGFLHDAAEFDASFFGISPREATAMDPQQRLLLEVAWEALERAGIAPTSLRGSNSGVFVGSYHWGAPAADTAAELRGHALTGTAASVLSGRLSYTLGLEGPAVTVDTACSSSLVALHLATQSLRAGESGLALIGGVTLLAEPSVFVEFSAQGGLAPDGRCKAFSDAADGTGWAEGVGVLVAERLCDARANGHRVLAVIRGSAVNQDGASNGLTAPNGPSQERVIHQALTRTGLTAADVDAVEAHGTGTRLGDPIEAQALLATYGAAHTAEQPLWLGSLKSNIGHTQAAAGVAGVIKMVMALRHGWLPGTLHADEPSSHVDWSAGTVRLLAEAREWPVTGRPRRAAVSSFGISGTNAHALLEQAPEAADAAADTGAAPAALPWIVSGHTEQALHDQAAALTSRVADDPALRPQDIGHTLHAARALLDHRAVVVAPTGPELLAGTEALAAGRAANTLVRGVADVEGRTVFVFPGQGSQWVGMGARLLEAPVFAERIAECAAALGEFTDWSLVEVLRGVEGAPSLERVDVVQPASFAVMVSLAALWRAHGVVPDAVVGHSQGEIAAAVVSGGLSLRDGARVVALRSQAIGRSLAGRGGMMSVALPVDDLESRLGGFDGRVSVAAVNGPGSAVVSGEPDALEELQARLAAEGVRARRIAVDYASHSHQVEDLHDELLEALTELTPRESEVPFFSTATGGWLNTSALDADYWFRNLRGRVRFADAVGELLAGEYRAFVEVSSHPVLSMAVQEAMDEVGVAAVAVGTLRREQGGLDRFLLSVGEAFVRGVEVDWSRAFEGTGASLVDLPTYAFQHERYWPARTAPDHPTADAPMDAEFWAAVEQLDLSALTAALGTDEESVAAILPGLTSWRRARSQRATLDSWRYRTTWTPLAQAPRASLTGTWLLVTADGVDDAEVVGALTEHGAEVRRLVLDEACTDRAVLAARLAGAQDVAGVVSVLAEAEDDDAHHPGLTRGLALSLALVQALGDAEVPAPLWFLTRGAFATGPSDTVARPLQAQVAGVGWTAALEHPQRWGGTVDLPAALDARAAQRLAAVLSGALGAEDQLAVRPAGVLARRIVRAGHRPEQRARAWSPRGTTLVTGGSGTLAPHLARWLAERGAEHVVLVSRRGTAAPGAPELRAELADLGTEATFAACDITDRAAVAALLDGLKADGRTVRTVIHAAATIELAALADTTAPAFADVVHAKVTGARILDELLDDAELDDFVLYSSTAGMWGSGVHAAYVAGNAYLSALAEHRRARGLRATSVHWGKWPDDRARELADPHRIRRSGLEYLDPDVALTGLQQVLDDDETVIGLMDIDWDTYHDVFTAGRAAHLFDRIPEVRRRLDRASAPAATGPATSDLAAQLHGLAGAEQDRLLLALVRTEAAAVLGHASAESFPERRAFRDLGFDSVTAVDLRNRLAAGTGLRLPSTLVFDHPNCAALAAFLKATALGATGDAPRPGPAAGSTPAAVDDDPIVVIGMSCRYPGGADTPEELLRLALDGADAISAFPTDRGWDARGLYDPDPDRAGHTYSLQGGFLHDAAGFDPGFFGISPREALAMDPQQRLLLETSWEACERAGIAPESLRGNAAGTFFGASYQDYSTTVQHGTGESEAHMVTGTAASVLSGRVSYLLGLEGPAVTVDTACSSSLVALHLACQSLRSGESSLALAGGAAVMATPHAFVGFSRQRALAEDGRCKPFSDAADGMTLAEGVGVVLLERLSDARANGHRVLAVIRGSAVNQDGASNGLTAPNGPSQQRVIRAALANSGLTTADVDAVEAHGTGTTLGDPIEAQALLATYGQDRDPQRPLLLGSVKSNIGHTQAAAGVAGVIKMVQAMAAGVLPGTLHLDEPSRHVDWEAGAVALLTEGTPWPETGRPRRAGVSSFGISGTNAHLILEQAPATEPLTDRPEDADTVVAWPLSAKSPAALRAQAAHLLTTVERAPDLPPARVGHALATTRTAFDHRAVVVGERREELLRGLTALSTGSSAAGLVTGAAGPDPAGAVFVFPGQGSQWWGMGRELLADSEVFRTAVDDCAAALAPYVDWSLHDVLAGEGDPALLERVDVVQPALFAMMVALSALWRAHGVAPAAVVGHSQGEIAAACVAGALSLADAARVVALRSQALPQLSGRGGMMSVSAPVERVAALLAPWQEALSVAAVNGPGSVVVSGDTDALDALQAACEEQGVRARRVSVDYASHGRHVEAVRDELARVLAPVSPRAPEVPFYSTVTGARIDDAAFDGTYWYTNLRQTVRMEEATRALLAAGHRVFVEVSPHPVLAAPIQETQEAAAGDGAAAAVVLGSLRRDEGGRRRFLTSLAEAHSHGAPVDWTTTFARPAYGPVDLPTYPFQRRDFWPAPRPATPAAGDASDAAFWELVDNQDPAALADALGVPADEGHTALGAVLPALSAWRTKSRARSRIDALRYHVEWTRVPEPAVRTTGRLLVAVPPDHADTPWVAAVLDALGTDTVRFEAKGTDRAAWAAHLGQLVEDGEEFAAVVSLLAAAEDLHPDLGSVPLGLGQTLVLVQALGDAGLTAPLWCLTHGAVTTGHDDTLGSPVQGALWGLGRVVALEHPDRWGGLIDLPATPDARTAARLTGLLADPAGEDQLAVRASGILARRLAHAAPAAPRPGRRWTGRGTCLITGGTGGIGGRVARWMAEHGAPHLLLTSRRGPDAPGAAELRAELEALGARVTLAACDAADRDALAALLATLPDDQPLTSVFHSAGVADGDARVADLTLDQLDALLRAKLTAAHHLHALTADRDLDAFVLFSSGAAVWGSGGQPGYAAANAYLDALAAYRRSLGLTGASVAWGTWGEVGMATDPEVHERLHRQGVRAMEPDHALGALQQMLEDDDTTLAVTLMDWEVFAPSFTATRPSALIGTVPEAVHALTDDPSTTTGDGAAPAVPPLRHHLEELSAAERGRALVDAVRAEAAATLGHDTPDAVPAGRAFRDVGFDSVTAVELRNRLRTALGLPLPAALVFDHPTPTALAGHLGTLLFGTAPEDPDTGRPDDPDARIREALATVPIGRLRKAGLLDLVLKLADSEPADDPAPEADGASESLDDMDAEALLRLATENSAN